MCLPTPSNQSPFTSQSQKDGNPFGRPSRLSVRGDASSPCAPLHLSPVPLIVLLRPELTPWLTSDYSI